MREVYLDNAATMIKNEAAIQAETDFYHEVNANPLRGLYKKSVQAKTEVDACREAVKRLVLADDSYAVIFTKNATEALNLVANGLILGDDGFGVVEQDAKVVVDIESHHSNILPWTERFKNVVVSKDLAQDITGASVVSLVAVSNVTGEDLSGRIKEARMRLPEAILGLDGAQMVGHSKIDIKALGVDYIAFSGHKFGAPMGVGGLVIKKTLAEKLRPLCFGGGIVDSVSEAGEPVFTDIPERLEGGTLPTGAIYGLNVAAKEALENLDFDFSFVSDVAREMSKNTGVKVLAAKGSFIAFQVEGVHPHDVAQFLAEENISVRAGWLCAEPFLRFKGWGPVVRASFSRYNTADDGERLVSSLKKIRGAMGIK